MVVRGNVDSDTLIKKLIRKTGKHAELWPEKPDSKKKKQPKPEKHSDPESGEENGEKNDKETVKVVVQDASKNGVEATTAKNTEPCTVKAGEGYATGKAGVQFQEPKPEVRQAVTVLAGNTPPVTEKKVSIAVQAPHENEASNATAAPATGGGGGGGGGGKKKKKKSKGNNNNNINNGGNQGASVTVEHSGDAPVTGGSGNQFHGMGPGGPVPISSPANESPPRHHMYHQYSPHYYAPPPPVYTVSYHTANPSSSSYGAAHYATPQPYSYAHVVRPGGTEMETPPYVYESESYTSQPSDSFELFSEENPNACSVM